MDLGTIVNPGNSARGIRTATSDNSLVAGMDAPHEPQIRRKAQRFEEPFGPRRHQRRTSSAKQHKRAIDEQRVRGGAKASTLPTTSPARMGVTSSRHQRHRQPPSPAADRRLGTRTPPRQARSAPLPHASPAKDLLLRAQRSAATETDASGRRPFIMDIVLGGRPAVLQHGEDAILEAIELSHDALRPTAGSLDPEGERGLATLHGDGRSANAGTAGVDDTTSQRVYRVSAERSTAVWTQCDTSPREVASARQIPSLSVGTPQHMQ